MAMDLEISWSSFSQGEELWNELLWDVFEGNSINGCKRQLVRFIKKFDGLCAATSWVQILGMQQGQTYPTPAWFLTLPWRLQGWTRQAPVPKLTLLVLSLESSHPSRLLCPHPWDSLWIYSAMTMASYLVHGFKCQELLVGMSCHPLAWMLKSR